MRIEDILPEGIEIEVRLDPDDPAFRELGLKGPVTGSFHIKKMGPQILVRGNVQALVALKCARCLADFDAPISEEVNIEMRPAMEMERFGHDIELGADDLDVEFFRGDVLDLGHLVAEQIALALPMKPLCREDCSGICSRCGADRALGPCQCEPPMEDSRWEALSELRDRLKKKRD